MTRRYDMQRRAREAAVTRAAIVEAAYELLDDRTSTLTLDEVARAAGVSRATLYNHFDSRGALLATVFEDMGRRIRYQRVQRAQALPHPRQALLGMLREVGRAWSSSRRVLRRIDALAVMDPEIGALVSRYEGYRRAEVLLFVRRLRAARLFGPRPGEAEAAALLSALTSPQCFDVLRAGSSARVATERLVHVALASLGIPLEPESGHARTTRRRP